MNIRGRKNINDQFNNNNFTSLYQTFITYQSQFINEEFFTIIWSTIFSIYQVKMLLFLIHFVTSRVLCRI